MQSLRRSAARAFGSVAKGHGAHDIKNPSADITISLVLGEHKICTCYPPIDALPWLVIHIYLSTPHPPFPLFLSRDVLDLLCAPYPFPFSSSFASLFPYVCVHLLTHVDSFPFTFFFITETIVVHADAHI